MSRITGHDNKGRYILRNTTHATTHAITTDFSKLMNCCQATDNSSIFYNNMSGQGCTVGHNDIVAYYAIMSYVSIGHHQHIVANTCLIAFSYCSMNGSAFSYDNAITQNSNGVFALIF